MKKWLQRGLGLCLLPGLTGAAAPAGIPFTAAEQTAISTYRQHFQAIKTQAQLQAALHESGNLSKKLETRLMNYMDGLQKLDTFPGESQVKALQAMIPGLRPTFEAEGTALVLETDYKAFAQAAAKTPEKADDAFFALMKKAYGDYNYVWGAWFNQTWDYGGCTRLGKGIHTALFTELNKQKQGAFAAELKPLEEALLHDLRKSDKFCLPRPQVVKELQQLLPLLPAAAQPAMKKRFEQVKSDPKLKEFDCDGKGHCQYG